MQNTSKTALITGITGQDGSFLSEFLLKKGYEVHGVIRRASQFNTQRIDHIYKDPHLYKDPHESQPGLFLHYGDLSDGTGLRRILEEVRPDEVYNLAAQSHVRVSFDQPEYTVDVDAMGTLRLLESIRDYQQRTGHGVRFYQASSSEMFGASPPPQSENTPFHPRSPYACAKLYSYWQSINYRESYGLYLCNGILFNHESERRGETFVTRKITRAATRIKLGLQSKLFLGNLDAKRDWGFAGDFVEAMWLMLQGDTPDDYVVATGESHSVREFLDKTFTLLNLDPEEHVEIDPKYFRPAEVDFLQGDASKIRDRFGWQPKVSFDQLVERMVHHDLELAHREKILQDAGHTVYVGVGAG